jgi:5-methylthioribose kinase
LFLLSIFSKKKKENDSETKKREIIAILSLIFCAADVPAGFQVLCSQFWDLKPCLNLHLLVC